MSKRFLLFFCLFLAFSLFFSSCEEDVAKPIADFSATQSESDGKIYFTFNDLSDNNPTKWEWTFEGGFPKTSTEQNPTIVFKEPGVFNVKLISSNEGGESTMFKMAYINIARFINNMATDAEVTFGDQKKILPKRSKIQFAMVENYQTNCYVETSGKTPSGQKSGLTVFWDLEIDLLKYYFFEFGISSDLIFFNITNNTNHNINYFGVNTGNSTHESLEEILIPNDSKKYGIGYYVALSRMEVRVYLPNGYLRYINPTDFYIPWYSNQYVDLSINGSYKNGDELELMKYDNYQSIRLVDNEKVNEPIRNSSVKFLKQTGIK